MTTANISRVALILLSLSAVSSCALPADDEEAPDDLGAQSAAALSCPAGTVSIQGFCVAERALPLAPLSGSRSARYAPLLQWTFASGITTALVEVCADRACAQVVTSATVAQSQWTPPSAPLVPFKGKRVYWRVKAISNGAVVSTSPTWEVALPFTATAQQQASNAATLPSYLDLNGDDRADLVVSASSWLSLVDPGHVYVYQNLPAVTAPTVTLAGPTAAPSFGQHVVNAGDLDKDGFSELAVSEFVGPWDGRVYLYRGSASGIAAAPDLTLDSPCAGCQFGARQGHPLVAAGDVNGDGFGDLAVAAPLAANGGAVYVYFGSAAGIPATPSQTILPFDAGMTLLGSVMTPIGDVNHDGYADLAIAMLDEDTVNGKIGLFYGRPTGLRTTPSQTLTGSGFQDYHGQTMAGAGDTNGDGSYDLACMLSPAQTPALGVYYGAAHGLATTVTSIMQVGTLQNLAALGDMSGDGLGDVAVYESGAGMVMVLHGNAQGFVGGVNLVAPPAPPGSGAVNRQTVTGTGDLGGDGKWDLAIAKPDYPPAPNAPAGTGSGHVFVYLTGALASPTDLANPASGLADPTLSNFGFSVAR